MTHQHFMFNVLKEINMTAVAQILSVDEKEFMFELKYRPQTIQECILPEHDKTVFLELVKKGRIPHLILQSNSPGTGKTTVAKALCHDIDAEYMFVNGSDCKVDFVRNELTRFASSKSIEGKQKVIIIDEFDRHGVAEAQRHLRTFMETYGKNCSIVMTANNLEGIIKPLQSRANVIKFGVPTAEDSKSMMRQMIIRCKAICERENITLGDKGLNVLAALVQKNFPDFRETIKQLDHYSTKGVIDEGILSVVLDNRGSIDDVVNALKGRDLATLRTLATKYATQYPYLIKELVNQIYPMVDVPSKFRLYEIAGENNSMHGLAANLEIHLMFMFTRLSLELKWV